MSLAPITIEPMQPRYNRPVSQLLAQAFQAKFHRRLHLSGNVLAKGLETLLDYAPAGPFAPRSVALQQGEVIGSIGMKYKSAEDQLVRGKRLAPLPAVFPLLRRRGMVRLLAGLATLEHYPEAGECYITDLAVHPAHHSKGVGRQLLGWAGEVVAADPGLDRLSLHVAASNPRARQLYERLSFQTSVRQNRQLLYLVLGERAWEYMVLIQKGGQIEQ
ncbi:GNAT family N-acetyltransferase [Paenibacillus sp. FSL H3-0469]|uniref:GNAT family N-acetyltransferase n=1 Tax=Paenibacillus sp. FSL H3-0469 TaxID=2954506 RepID=UPI0031015C7E